MFVRAAATNNTTTLKYNYNKMAHTNGSFDDIDLNMSMRPTKTSDFLEISDASADLTHLRSRSASPFRTSISHRSSTYSETIGVGSDVNLTSKVGSRSDVSVASRLDKPRSGPSSRRTVLVIASFFVVGTIFLLSGVIILAKENNTSFIVAGSIFVAVGATSFVLCLFLQQKNLKKLMRDLEQDLYFLNMADTPLLRSFFSFDSNSYNVTSPKFQ